MFSAAHSLSHRLIYALIALAVLLFCVGCCPFFPGGNVTAPLALGGSIDAHDFTVPAAQYSAVASDLVVNASGSIRIDGLLMASQAATPGAKGASVRLIAGGDIEIRGTVKAGDGAAGLALTANKLILLAQDGAADPAGGDGGEVELSAGGNLVIHAGARVASGIGGGGSTGPLGGAGGKGGDIKLGAGGLLSMKGALAFGNGGGGGTPMGANAQAGAKLGGRGGDSGVMFLKAGSVEWADYNSNEHSIALQNSTGPWSFEGGIGGSGGVAFVTDVPGVGLLPAGAPANAQAAVRLCNSASCEYFALPGGDGFFSGGVGGSLTIAVTLLPQGSRDGPVIKAYGGRGGNLVRKFDPQYGNSVVGRLAYAGTGGAVRVTAANGAFGEDANAQGGFGGTAIAYGGDGGDGSLDLLQFGGQGGLAEAFGGYGGPGNSGCGAVGNGGAGGIANAFGGKGGSAGFRGLGGEARARGGPGGDGGDGGASAGAAGAGGAAVAKGGAAGQYNASFAGQPLDAVIESTQQGKPGVAGEADVHPCD